MIGCLNNTEEPSIDCSNSDLSIVVESSTKSSCQNGGSVTVRAEGGAGGYEFSSDGTTFVDSNVLGNLFAGSLTLFVRDSDGCSASVTFDLEAEDNSIVLNIESTISDCATSTGTITASATGGSGSYSFTLDGGSPNANGSFESVSGGAHEVVAVDSDGCEVTKSVTIETESTTSLSADIVPIVNTNCAVSGCHNGSQFPNLSSPSNIMSNASRVKARTSAGTMPPSGRSDLTELEIKQIACWVDDGAKNN